MKTVWLEIGQLSCVEPEAMRFCFDAVTRGSVADVQRMVEGLIEDLGEGGGYIFSNCHNIQPDVPAENILAMADAARAGKVSEELGVRCAAASGWAWTSRPCAPSAAVRSPTI